MRKLRNIMAILFALSLMQIGCQKKEGNSSSGVVTTTFMMTGSSQAATVAQQNKSKSIFDLFFVPKAVANIPSALVDSTGAVVNLTDAWVVIKEIEFESEESEGVDEVDGLELEFKGPYFVDLLSSAPSALDTAEVAIKDIRRIKMKLHKAETLNASAPAQLANNSIYVVGTVAGNQFTYLSEDGSEFKISGATAIRPSDAPMLVSIRFADIIKQIDMSGVTNGVTISSSNRVAGSNLCPSIDPSANDLFTCFRKGLEHHADFGNDHDGDGEFEVEDEKVD